MKIAAASDNGMIFPHFGHTPEFAIFEVAEERLIGMKTVSTEGNGHGALAGLLAENHVDVLLCGGIGAPAQDALKNAGVKVVGGVSGDVVEAVGAYLLGTLQAEKNFTCKHHHEEHHSCDAHSSCGEDHTCGSCH